MSLIDNIIDTLRSGQPVRHGKIRMGIAGEGPELALVADAFRRSPDVGSLVYFHPDKSKAARFAKTAEIPDSCSDIGEFVPAVDAAEILSIPGAREEVAETLLKSGVHLSLSKPFAASLDEAGRLRRAAAEGGAHLRVDDEAFFYQPYNKLKDYIDTMEIGEVCAARFRVSLAGKGGWGPLPELLKGGDYIFHPCFNQFALAIDLLGEIESVIAYISPMKPKSGGQAMIGFKCKAAGRYGVLEFTYAPQTAIRTEGHPCDASIEIAGTDGIIWMNHFYGKMTETPWIEVRRGKKYFSYGIGSGLELDWADAVRASAAHFAHRAARDAAPRPEIAKHYRALKILLAAREASETSSEIKV